MIIFKLLNEKNSTKNINSQTTNKSLTKNNNTNNNTIIMAKIIYKCKFRV